MDKEIAFELGISQRAVEGHLRGAREKLGVASTRAAVLMVAATEGWEGSVEPYYGPSDLPDAADSGAIPFPDEEGPVQRLRFGPRQLVPIGRAAGADRTGSALAHPNTGRAT